MQKTVPGSISGAVQRSGTPAKIFLDHCLDLFMDKLIFSFTLIVLGVCCGYLFKQLTDRGRVTVSYGLDGLRRIIQKFIFFFLNPIAVASATWIVTLEDVNLLALPVLCVVSLGLGGLMAYGLAKCFRMGRRQTGAYICSGTFTNIGALGALFCFLFLGEPGFALIPIYKLFEEFIYFSYVFPLARSFGIESSEKLSLLQRLKIVFSDPFVVVSIASISIGLVLNRSGLPRPEFFATVNAVVIPVMVFLLLFTIGMGMQFSGIRGNVRPALLLSAAKFVLSPLIITGLGYMAGLHLIDGGLPLKVVCILSAMPVGFLSVVPPSLYDLDLDLANACWLICNSLLLIQVPLLLFVIHSMPFTAP